MNNERTTEGLFSNSSEKIKKAAKLMFAVFVALGVIAAIVFVILADEFREDLLYIGALAALVLFPLLAWPACISMYGFGETVERVALIERNTRGNSWKSDVQTKVDIKRIENLENLRAQNLITEEEYQAALEKTEEKK